MTWGRVIEQDFEHIVSYNSEFCVSIVVPFNQAVPDPHLNQIKFKHLLHNALSRLEISGNKNSTYLTLKNLGHQLLSDRNLWLQQSPGFIVFVSDDESYIYELDKHYEELIQINNHFYIVPLISQIINQSNFYLLELDKEHTQMWKGNEHSLQKISVPNLPHSITEVTGTEVNERNLQFHTNTKSPRRSSSVALYYGSSKWKDDHHRYLLKFLQSVDSAVTDFLTSSKDPLILSGVKELEIAFRNISKYPNILKTTLPKETNPAIKEKNLHQLSWAAVSDLIQNNIHNFILQYQETVPSKRVTDTCEVLRQASQGKIDSLLIAEHAKQWGSFDANTLSSFISGNQISNNDELFNIAARLTLLNRGKVTTVPQTQMPDNASIAALLRF